MTLPAPNLPVAAAYFAEIDGLRTVAISLVMLEHFGGLLATPFSAGYYGVDLFFVISGFLITAILLRTQGPFGRGLYNFLGRRSLRIFPLYYAALTLLWFADFKNTREGLPWLATYTWNYYAARNMEGNWLFYLWSLSVEEQFYLVWPFAVLTLRDRQRMLSALIAVMVLFGYAQLMFNIAPQIAEFNYTGLPSRMSSLGMGAIGAVLYINNLVPRSLLRSWVIEVATFVALAYALICKWNVLQFPLMGFCSLIIVLKCAYGEFGFTLPQRLLAKPPIVRLGRVSYCIYICHWPLGLAFNEYLFDPIWASIEFSGPFEKLRWNAWIFKFPMVYALSVVVALISWRFFENPILKLKDVWFPANRKEITAKAT